MQRLQNILTVLGGLFVLHLVISFGLWLAEFAIVGWIVMFAILGFLIWALTMVYKATR